MLQKGTGEAVAGAAVVVMENNDYVMTDSSGLATLEGVEALTRIKVLAFSISMPINSHHFTYAR